ncbi:hypothetical protein [Fictibacillus terranigra]|uniref:Uncharacterized protein n=1 Tax=Fictibacillus terranigra TaxID=3058424 RepID=A0ABT8E912_9BACL|nr:hypothetical protein [Fictibacillus sp. CENA-BCM004]MDN4074401.1 hypothetical protein [Fictibacillus sp. CENA-BCM004]
MKYDEMNAKANQFAPLLIEKRIRKNERVAIMSRNNEHFFYGVEELIEHVLD